MAQGDRAERGFCPPILTLVRAAREHRAAFAYDWRTRFGVPFDPPTSMTYAESWHLMLALAVDPSSHVGAALAGWDHPVSREWLVTADLYDAFIAANSKKGRKPKPYPRPWPDRNKSRPRPTVTPEVAIAALREAGHTAALPKGFRQYEVAPPA